jgi:hypothetical protein
MERRHQDFFTKNILIMGSRYWLSDRQKFGIYEEIRNDKLIYADFNDVIFKQHPIYTMSGYINVTWKEVLPEDVKMLKKKEITKEEFLSKYWG